jgi:hypothetical protein
MEVAFDSEEASVTEDFTAVATTNFNLRFYLAQRSLVIPNLALVDIAQVFRASGATKKAYLQLYRANDLYYVIYGVFDDAGAEGFAPPVALPDPWPAFIELTFGEASNATSEDAFLALLFDGVEQDRIAGFDLFDHFDFDRVTVGRIAVSGTEPTGVLHLDEVAAHTNAGFFTIGAEPSYPLQTLRAVAGLPTLKLLGRTGTLWETYVSNLGDWSVRLPSYAPAGDPVRGHEVGSLASRQFLDTSEASIWLLRVDDSVPSAPIIETVDLGTTNAQHVRERSVFSSNGREWGVTINASGTPVLTALSSQWPVNGQPRILLADGRVATFTVTDGGSIAVVDTPMVPVVHQTMRLRAQDDSAVFVVSVDSGLNVTASSSGTELSDTLFYDYEVQSPNGTRWRIQSDEAGTLTPWNVDAFDASRYGYPLIIDKNGKPVAVDSRFKRPSAHKSGWGRRTFRGGRA